MPYGLLIGLRTESAYHYTCSSSHSIESINRPTRSALFRLNPLQRILLLRKRTAFTAIQKGRPCHINSAHPSYKSTLTYVKRIIELIFFAEKTGDILSASKMLK